MSVSNSISPSERQWLLKLIEDKFQIALNSHYACLEFSKILKDQFNISISYNTIRRLFGIVQSNNLPSQYTLDKLASTIGFTHYKSFKAYIQTFDTDYFNGILFLYRSNGKTYSEKLIQILKYLDYSTHESAYKLKAVVELAIQFDDYILLEQIVQIDFDVSKTEVVEKLFISFQEFHIQAEKENYKVIQFVLKHIHHNLILQKCLLQHFVIEHALNGYYGEWLASITETPLPDFYIFRDLMFCQKAFSVKNVDEARFYYKRALKAMNKANFDIHAKLKGRIAAWDFILNHSQQKFNTFYFNLKTNVEYASFIIVYYRLIWIYKDGNYINENIQLKPIQEFQSIVSVHLLEIISKYCIIYANCLLLKNNTSEIRDTLELVHIDILFLGEHKWFRNLYHTMLSREILKAISLSN